MKLTLSRFDIDADGACGNLHNEDRSFELFTIERTYPTESDIYWQTGQAQFVKLPPGTYTCVRGPHQLANGPKFETFEITGVPGRTGMLFHSGNFETDSEGCVLVGRKMKADSMGRRFVAESKLGFQDLMKHLEGLNEFTLEVKNL